MPTITIVPKPIAIGGISISYHRPRLNFQCDRSPPPSAISLPGHCPSPSRLPTQPAVKTVPPQSHPVRSGRPIAAHIRQIPHHPPKFDAMHPDDYSESIRRVVHRVELRRMVRNLANMRGDRPPGTNGVALRGGCRSGGLSAEARGRRTMTEREYRRKKGHDMTCRIDNRTNRRKAMEWPGSRPEAETRRRREKVEENGNAKECGYPSDGKRRWSGRTGNVGIWESGVGVRRVGRLEGASEGESGRGQAIQCTPIRN
jgi:hypothetical protein